MHQIVADRWEEFSRPLEGRVGGMYCDILGLVTCGVGNLIDPIPLAEQLPWTLADGTPADLAQVRADWHKLKGNASYYAKRHYNYALAATKVRLTDEAIDNLVAKKRAEFEGHLKRHHFPEWETFPADAQLGIMSMAWACGPGFPVKFGNFKRAVINRDWSGAVASCKIREEGNPGVVPRNKHNRLCFSNAAIVEKLDLDRAQLFWPGVATPPDDIATDDRTGELRRAAQVALTLASDVVGTPGANLRAYELGPDDDGSDPAPPAA
jgi:hypothetical protein